MGLFGKKEDAGHGLLGIDIGTGGIKMVEIQKKSGRPHLVTYGYTSQEGPDAPGNIMQDTKLAASVLKELHAKSGSKSKQANVSLPSHEIFHAIVTVPQPKKDDSELKHMIEAQTAKLLPLPLNEMILDSTVIDQDLLPKKQSDTEKKGKEATKQNAKSDKDEKNAEAFIPLQEERTPTKHIRVLVSGSPKKLVQQYLEVFKASGLELASLETEAFALVRSLIGKDTSHIMLVDIGYERSNITVVHDGIPFLHRSIQAGGAMVTRQLAKSMGVSEAEAEQFKLDLALNTGDVQSIPPAVHEVLAPLIHEIKYSLSLYDQQVQGMAEVEKIIITGGSAHLPYLESMITNELDMNVFLGDPWARIATPVQLRPVLDEIGPRFSVAAGLAMKGMRDAK